MTDFTCFTEYVNCYFCCYMYRVGRKTTSNCWMIWFEESFGIEYCTENLEYSLHLASDIYRHSSPDNYWCFVQFYMLETTNQKTLCRTFADCASQLRFISSFQQLQDTTQGGVDFNSTITSENLICQSLTSSTAIGLKGNIYHKILILFVISSYSQRNVRYTSWYT